MDSGTSRPLSAHDELFLFEADPVRMIPTPAMVDHEFKVVGDALGKTLIINPG